MSPKQDIPPAPAAPADQADQGCPVRRALDRVPYVVIALLLVVPFWLADRYFLVLKLKRFDGQHDLYWGYYLFWVLMFLVGPIKRLRLTQMPTMLVLALAALLTDYWLSLLMVDPGQNLRVLEAALLLLFAGVGELRLSGRRFLPGLVWMVVAVLVAGLLLNLFLGLLNMSSQELPVPTAYGKAPMSLLEVFFYPLTATLMWVFIPMAIRAAPGASAPIDRDKSGGA